MLNLGGPSTLAEVEPFLRRLFSDREIVQMPFPESFQTRFMGPFISARRTPRIQNQYSKIGGGSPIRKWTQLQGQAMQQLLDRLSPATAPHKAYIAFRYANPLTEETLQLMKADGVKRAVAFTQYPQWSCTTTGGSLNELWRQLKNAGLESTFTWSVIDRWPTHPIFIDAVVKKIHEGLAKFEKEADRRDCIILFSAHSLPLKVINKGDAYPQEVGATVQKVMDRLGHSHRFLLSYQSQVGPVAWLGPQTIEVVANLGKKGEKNVLVVPIAFTSDHIETLFEIDHEIKEKAAQSGVTNFHRAPSLNDDPTFVEALADIVANHLKGEELHGPQYRLRCPSCINPQCRNILNPIRTYVQPPL
jgi:ferrochelatase